jgi:hypothetical protein
MHVIIEESCRLCLRVMEIPTVSSRRALTATLHIAALMSFIPNSSELGCSLEDAVQAVAVAVRMYVTALRTERYTFSKYHSRRTARSNLYASLLRPGRERDNIADHPHFLYNYLIVGVIGFQVVHTKERRAHAISNAWVREDL